MDHSPQGARALALHRFFFALKPSRMDANRIHAFAEAAATGAQLVRPEHQHMTLAITGDFGSVPQPLVEAMHRAGETVRAAPFALRLDRLSGGVRSLALRPAHAIPALSALQRAIAAAMAREGVPMRRGWTFSPHQTLGYREGRPVSRPIDGFGWHVEEFVLIHSHVGRTRHDALGRWRLEAGDQLSLF